MTIIAVSGLLSIVHVRGDISLQLCSGGKPDLEHCTESDTSTSSVMSQQTQSS